MRGAVVDLERLRPAAHIDAEPGPGERLLEYPLPKIPREKKSASGARRRDCGKQAKFGHAEILSLVHHNMREGLAFPAGIVRRHLGEDLRPSMEAAIIDCLSGGSEYRAKSLARCFAPIRFLRPRRGTSA